MAAEPAARRGNVFTRRIGPLPMWVWLVIVAVIVVGWAYWRNRQSAGQASSSSTATGTDASQVPQFVNQTYTTVQPPTVTVGGPSKIEESEESEEDTDDAQKKRKRPVNRKHPTHHKPRRKPVPPRVNPGGPVRWVTPPVKQPPYRAA